MGGDLAKGSGGDGTGGSGATPTGAAGGDLGGEYPNPTVNDGADGSAIHDNEAGEIAALSVVTADAADHLLIEDADDSNNKKRVLASDFLGGGGGILQGETWFFNTATGDADPGGAAFRVNNADQSLATQAFIDDIANNSATMGAEVIALLAAGDVLYIEQQDDSTRYALYSITGATIDGTGYRKVQISALDNGSALVLNKACTFRIFKADDQSLGTYFKSAQDNEVTISYTGGAGNVDVPLGVTLPALAANQIFSLLLRILGANDQALQDVGEEDLLIGWATSPGAHPVASLAALLIKVSSGGGFTSFPLANLKSDGTGQLILTINSADDYEATIKVHLSPLKTLPFAPV